MQFWQTTSEFTFYWSILQICGFC